MKLTHLTAAVVMALSGASALAVGGPLDLSSGTTGFASTPVAGAFSEVFTFTLTTPSSFTGSVTSVMSGTQDVDFTSIAVSGPAGTFQFTQALGDPFELWTLGNVSLSAGNYTLTLTGTNSASIGSYSGTVGVSAVPEPSAAVLAIAGLALMGFKIRRMR